MKSIILKKSATKNERNFDIEKCNFSPESILAREALKAIKGGGGEDDDCEEDAIIYM